MNAGPLPRPPQEPIIAVMKTLSGPLRYALVLALCAAASACGLFPLTYSGAPISGRVTDAQTGAPIEGAVVLATWKMSGCCATFQSSLRHRVVAVSETMTDAQGNYRIEAWGPIDRPLGYERVAGFDPMISVFKPQYEPAPLMNVSWKSGAAVNDSLASALKSIHDGEDIRLKPYGEDAVRKLKTFAAVLDANALEADEDTRLYAGNAIRQRVMSMQRRSVSLIDTELRRLGNSYEWSTPVSFVPGR